MASFQSKICWEGREREKIKKKIVPMRSNKTRNRKLKKKIAKKLKKLKKHHYCFFSSENQFGKAEKKRK